MDKENRLVVVSNRLPVVVDQSGNLKPGAGGLITALMPIMKRADGLWIGWAGSDKDEGVIKSQLKPFAKANGYSLATVALSAEDIEDYYHGFSNETVWPLFHDMIGRTKFELDYWLAYSDVNAKFARAIKSELRPNDVVWIHDYHLMMAGHHLRSIGADHPLAFFLHIPFPSYDLYRRLPWKKALISAILQYDMIGFQTHRDHRNFIDCVRGIVDGVKVEYKKRTSIIHLPNRTVRVGHFPISIDFDEFYQAAKSEEAAEESKKFHKEFSAKCIALGVDRLDYTKGIAQRFLAFEKALEKYPDLRRNISLFQLVVPSRTEVGEYRDLKRELDELVGRINGTYSGDGWMPIHYQYRTMTRLELLGRYRACEIALITPERDGMNLVAKEYCASQVDDPGVLVLSEFAGTADQFANKGAIIINPFDREGTADAIYRAYNMSKEEKRRRMTMLRKQVKRYDVYQWVKFFLDSFTQVDLGKKNKKSKSVTKSSG